MLPVIVIVTCIFGFLFLGRMAGARRATLAAQVPVLILAGAAVYALARGAYWAALGLGAAAVIAWMVTPRARRRSRSRSGSRSGSGAPRANPTHEDAADVEARAVLGVRAGASEADIRAAYRSRMARAHPDRGGSHAEAARLTAARDRLLRRRR